MSSKRSAPDSPINESQRPQKKLLVQDGKGRPRFKGCSRVSKYEIIGKLGEGTFGVVNKAVSTTTRQFVAMKQFNVTSEREGFPITALREIKILKQLDHKNIIKLLEMAVEGPKKHGHGSGVRRGSIMMVTPYMHHDLSGLLENPAVKLTEPHIKCYMLQLLEGMKYLHANSILHRDIKAANLLINNKGILQIADFGLARRFDEPVPKPGSGGGVAKRNYTSNVVTRWYRAPELCLGERAYTTAVDMWGVGCVFGEMYKRSPILPGNSDVNQTLLIFQLCGSPTDKNMPGWEKLKDAGQVSKFPPCRRKLEGTFSMMGSAGVTLLSELLKLNPQQRINAMDALKHEFFSADPLPAASADLPQFPDSHEFDRRAARDARKQNLPPAPAGGTVGLGQSQDWGVKAGEQPYGNGHARRQPNAAAAPTHRPPWAKEQGGGGTLPPPPNSLPPNPHTGQPAQQRRVAKPPTNVDTYIPNYSTGGRPREWDRERDREHHPRERERDRDWERDRERDHRDRDRERPRDRDRSRDMGWDRDREAREREREREQRERELEAEKQRKRDWRR